MDFQYLKGVFKYVASVLLSAVLIAYILYHIAGGFQSEILTSAAELTTMEETLTLRATVMRNEKVLYSPVDGEVNYLYSDGDKLPTQTAVAEVYPAEGSGELQQSILALDRMIRLLENSNMSDSEKRTDTASTDKLIWKTFYAYVDYAEAGRVSDATNSSEDLLIQMNKRRIITHTVNDYNSLIEKLKAEKSSLTSRLPSVQSTVVTDEVGYFYSAVDGYESVFSSENIATLTYSDYLDLCQRSPEDHSGTGVGYPIGKLVTDHLWYLACEVETDQLHYFESGSYYDVKFPYNGGIAIRMYLYRILSDVGAGSAVLLFRTDILPQDFNYLRTQTVQIVKSSHTGYRVPASAVHIVDGKEGVYILRGSLVRFRRIKTLFESDGYFIVKERDESADDRADWLAKNEFVIVKGKDLYDGKIIN